MKVNALLVVVWGCLAGGVNAFAPELNVTTPPACALSCIVTYVPKYCNTLANVTCVCTDPDLTLALQGCAVAACNITDSLRLLNYKDRTCGVKNDKSHQNQDMRMHVVLTPLVFLFIACRLYIRVKMDGLGLDDWSMVLAGFFYMASAGIAFPSTMMGYGQHTWYLEPSTFTLSMKFFYTSELLYGFTLTFTKISLLLFFRRVFPNRSIQIGSIYVGAFILASNVAVISAMAGQCTPVSANWTNWMYKTPPVKCIDSFAVIMFFASVSIFHDAIILIMPLPILWGLQLNWKKKTQAMLMFSVGLFVIICSAIRLPVLLAMRHTIDPSYDQAPVALWSYLEQAIGIICGCLPAFRSLLGFLFPRLRKGALGSSGPSSNQKSSGSHSKGSISVSRSRTNNNYNNHANPSPYHNDDIELGKKGTSQEQIVYLGRDGATSDDESDHFRLVPPHSSKEKMGTTVQVASKGYAASQTSTLREEVKGRLKTTIACPRINNMTKMRSNNGSTGYFKGSEGEINVTQQTVQVVERVG